MYDASGGPNLGVFVRCNIFHQKVYQPPPLLKCREEADNFSFVLIANCRDRHGLCRISFGGLGLGPAASADEDYHEQSQRYHQGSYGKIKMERARIRK